MRADEDDMLKFYSLETEYLQAKLRSNRFELRDKKFSDYFLEIHDRTILFNEDINTILRETNNLSSYDTFFMETINSLNGMGTNTSIIAIAKTIDKILMLSLRLLEIRTEIKEVVNRIITSLKGLKVHRDFLTDYIKKIDDLAEYYELEKKRQEDI